MSLQVPNLDDRSYSQLVQEALQRLAVSNPEYATRAQGDLGVTLIQLFAFMAESIIYRANKVPERNRRKFCQLLGIKPRPPRPARGLASFVTRRTESALLVGGTELRAGSVPFRTRQSVQVLPVVAHAFIKRARRFDTEEEKEEQSRLATVLLSLDPSLEFSPQEMVFYQPERIEFPVPALSPVEIDLGTTVDDSIWIALFSPPRSDVNDARRELEGKWLSLGVAPSGTPSSPHRVHRPGRSQDSKARLLVELPAGDGASPAYRKLPTRQQHDVLKAPGVLQVQLPQANELVAWTELGGLTGSSQYPPPIDDDTLEPRLVTWLRLRLDTSNAPTSRSLSPKLAWVGINAAEVEQRGVVDSEVLGVGNGKPDQSFRLTRVPVVESTVRVRVDGRQFRRVDDLRAAPPESPSLAVDRDDSELWPTGVSGLAGPRGENLAMLESAVGPADPQVFVVDAVSGEIHFGNGLFGERPRAGAQVTASYETVAGAAGNVPGGAVAAASGVPRGVVATNPLPTWGGADAESEGRLEQRIALEIQSRERLVSKHDFERALAFVPGVQVARLDVLAAGHPHFPERSIPGCITVLVVPPHDFDEALAPSPDRLFLDAVCEYLNPRRLLTTELHVVGPQYVNLSVSVGVAVAPDADINETLDLVKSAIRRFLSPVHGGHAAAGWELQRRIDVRELAAVASRITRVTSVQGVLLGAEGGRATAEGVIELSGIELPRLTVLGVDEGSPVEIEALTAGVESASPSDRRRFPVPVVPEEC